MSEIEQAKGILNAERQAVLEGLRVQRRLAEEAAKAQQEWRSAVQALLERGRAAELPVAEMADALGVSRQWANHLAKRRRAAYRAAQHHAMRMKGEPPPEEPTAKA